MVRFILLPFTKVLLLLCFSLLATNATTVDMHDWLLTDAGESCDEACNIMQGSCDAQATSAIDSPETALFVSLLLEEDPCEVFDAGLVFGNEPSVYGNNGNRICVHLVPGEETYCDATFGSEQRFCCCGPRCPVNAAEIEREDETVQDWILTGPGETCNDGCQAVGGSCNIEATANINTDDIIAFVSDVLDYPCEAFFEGAVFGNEPALYFDSGVVTCVHLSPGQSSDCDTSFGSEQRFCCCGSNCATSA